MHKFCSLSLSLEFIISILGLGIFDEVSVSSRSFNQVSVLKVTVSTASLCASHRCSGRQIFGGAKDFCPNSPKLARKKLKKVTSKNKLCMCFWEPFFQIKEGWAPFAHIFRGLLRFSRILRRFSAILLGFMECSSDFYQIKTLGVLLHTLHPSLLHHWCECHRVAVKQRRYAAAVADRVACWNLLLHKNCSQETTQKLRMCIKYARKLSFLLCGGCMYNYWVQNRYGFVINTPELPINDEARNDAPIASTSAGCISAHPWSPHQKTKRETIVMFKKSATSSKLK